MSLLRLDLPDVYYENGVKLGQILAKEDGYYDFWPDLRQGGYWSEEVLWELSRELNKLNQPWTDKINAYFDAGSR